MFQSAPPHDVRRPSIREHGGRRATRCRSIRAPARGATRAGLFQSAPPHGGRRPVSIRAPATWGRRVAATARVSIRAPARGATPDDVFADDAPAELYPFQSAPPRRGATAREISTWLGRMVSIRAPARGATSGQRRTCFNPRQGGRHSVSRARIGFNPRPRKGGDRGFRSISGLSRVSIRAPARGATFSRPLQRTPIRFNAPPHGGRHASTPLLRTQMFQSAPPRTGGDPTVAATAFGVVMVSIRAPARGATRCEARKNRAPARPTRRVTGDPHVSIRAPATGGVCAAASIRRSESAPPHGGRPAANGLRPQRQSFQSAPPRRGATRFQRPDALFQSAPPHGGRPGPACAGSLTPIPVSIRAPARGATIRGLMAASGTSVSIRAPARGATCTFLRDIIRRCGRVSIRAPAKGATPARSV